MYAGLVSSRREREGVISQRRAQISTVVNSIKKSGKTRRVFPRVQGPMALGGSRAAPWWVPRAKPLVGSKGEALPNPARLPHHKKEEGPRSCSVDLSE
jgi:hypothetical protein